jgi:hypothetical protein
MKIEVTNNGTVARYRLGIGFLPGKTIEIEVSRKEYLTIKAVRDFTVTEVKPVQPVEAAASETVKAEPVQEEQETEQAPVETQPAKEEQETAPEQEEPAKVETAAAKRPLPLKKTTGRK